jgi:cardiolipin synthase
MTPRPAPPHAFRPRGARPERADAFSLADALSLSRVAFAGALWFVEPAAGPTLGLMGGAALSDVADGWLARRLRGARPAPPGGWRGAWLDPLCDKVFILSLVAVLAVRLRPPGWLIALMCARELFLFVTLVLSRTLWARQGAPHVTYTANALGKATTSLQFVALALLAAVGRVSSAAVVVAVGSALTGSAAVIGYVARARRGRQNAGAPDGS